MSIEIRTLQESDAAAWWEIRRESLERDPSAFGKALEEHEQMPLELAQARFRDVAEGSFYLGAFQGAALVGMATFIREDGITERHKGNVYGVYVTATARRRGVGRALIAHIIERAQGDASLEQIRLAVSAHQVAAKELYASLGFERYGTERRALKFGSTYVDEDLMVLFLGTPAG